MQMKGRRNTIPKEKMEPERDPACKAVAELRKSLGLTQQQFAQKLAVAVRTIARWESEKPPDSALYDLAEFAEAQGQTKAMHFFNGAYSDRIQAYAATHPIGPQQDLFPELAQRPRLARAVRELRLAVGQTQQEFAATMGLAIATVTRWEAGHPPKGIWLGRMYSFAVDKGLPEIAELFKQELAREFNTTVLPNPLGADEIVSISGPLGADEVVYINYLLSVMRNRNTQYKEVLGDLVLNTLSGAQEILRDGDSNRIANPAAISYKGDWRPYADAVASAIRRGQISRRHVEAFVNAMARSRGLTVPAKWGSTETAQGKEEE